MSDEFCIKGICDGSGWIVDEESNVARPCECRRTLINRASSKRIGTGIPKRFRGVSMDRKPIVDVHPTIKGAVRRYIAGLEKNLQQGRGMWFEGDPSTGKTSLAMLISKSAVDAGHSVAIYSVPHLLADIKETYQDESTTSYMQLFKRLTSVDLLHLDDLGAEYRTQWVLEQLYSIVNERWQNEKSIVVTTNLQLSDLREQVGQRTVSRLVGICGDPIGMFASKDKRIEREPSERLAKQDLTREPGERLAF